MERVPTPVPSYSEQAADLPPEYTLPNPQFPSALDVDNIFHTVESYIDQESDTASEDEDNIEEIDVADDRMERWDQSVDDRQYSSIPAHPVTERQMSREMPLIRPTRDRTILPVRSISTRTRTTNARLTRRKALPRDNTADSTLR